jgi:hypothetical protein
VVTAQEAYRSTFVWAYKQCPCCKRVVPDSRKDEPGRCELCNVTRTYLDGPPIGWDQPYEVRDAKGKLKRITTLWYRSWENREPAKFCKHEKAAKEKGLF